MRVFTFNLPIDIIGVDKSVNDEVKALAREYGGWTMYPTIGAWDDPDDEVVIEPRMVLEVAITDETDALALVMAVVDIADLYAEQVLYLRMPDGQGHMLDLDSDFTEGELAEVLGLDQPMLL